MKVKPLHNGVLVERVEAESKTAGGIIIPDTAREKPIEGEILAVGPGERTSDGKIYPLELKVGQRIVFGKWSGTEVKFSGQEYLVMKESDIMGIVESKSA